MCAERSSYPTTTGSICAVPPGFGTTVKPAVHIFVNELRASRGLPWQKHVTVESVALHSTTTSFYAQHGPANVQLRPESSPGSTSVWVREPNTRLNVPQLTELLALSVGLPVTRVCAAKDPNKSPTSVGPTPQDPWQRAQYTVSVAATDQEADAALYTAVSDCLVKHGVTSFRKEDRPVMVLVAPGDCNDATALSPTTYNYAGLVQLALCCNFSVQLWGFKFNFPASLLALSAEPHVTVHWLDQHRERLMIRTKTASSALATTPSSTTVATPLDPAQAAPLSHSACSEGVAIMTLDGRQKFSVCQKWVEFCKADLCDKAHFKCVHHRRDDARFPHLDKPLCAFFLQGHCPKTHCSFAHPTIVGYTSVPATPSHSAAISHSVNSGVAVHTIANTMATPDITSMRANAPVFRRRMAPGPVNVTTAEGWTSAPTDTHACDSVVWTAGHDLGTTSTTRNPTTDIDGCRGQPDSISTNTRTRVAVNTTLAAPPTTVSSRFPPRSQWRQTSA